MIFMLQYMTLIVVAAVGFAGGPWWVAVIGAAALTIDGWRMMLGLLRQNQRLALSSKKITYFVTGVLSNIVLASLSYLVGAGLGHSF
jgi:hypothetical protein